MLRTKLYLYYFTAYLNTTQRYLPKLTRFHDKTPRAKAALPFQQDVNTSHYKHHRNSRFQVYVLSLDLISSHSVKPPHTHKSERTLAEEPNVFRRLLLA